MIPLLARLTSTKSEALRRNLAAAIAQCCSFGTNRVVFGSLGGVQPLVEFLRSSDITTLRATTLALLSLSETEGNCIVMRDNRVVPLLLNLMGFPDDKLQDLAASTLKNIRMLASTVKKPTIY